MTEPEKQSRMGIMFCANSHSAPGQGMSQPAAMETRTARMGSRCVQMLPASTKYSGSSAMPGLMKGAVHATRGLAGSADQRQQMHVTHA